MADTPSIPQNITKTLVRLLSPCFATLNHARDQHFIGASYSGRGDIARRYYSNSFDDDTSEAQENENVSGLVPPYAKTFPVCPAIDGFLNKVSRIPR